MPPSFARDEAQAGGEAGKLRSCLAALPEHGAEQQDAEPGRVLQWRNVLPDVPEHSGPQHRGQVGRLGEHRQPFLETAVLVPVQIVD